MYRGRREGGGKEESSLERETKRRRTTGLGGVVGTKERNHVYQSQCY